MFSAFTTAAVQANLTGPSQAVSDREIRCEERASILWRFTAVALGALACFVPLPAGAAFVGGCVWAMRKGIQAQSRSEHLRIKAIQAVVADLEMASLPHRQV